ncbi:MAG: 3-oxoacid CoA-transferase subunit A [Rhizobiaceae bacterium]|nr:3-oxoacid CoA-transferase subunit A [Rhizobiaceae bacterium]
MDKFVSSVTEAVADVRDGSTVMIGGFGVGQPVHLIDALIEQGATGLTIVANNAGIGRAGLARLLELRRVRKVVCSFPRTADPVVFDELYKKGEIELELVPQGTLAERIRAGGAGVAGFYTATAYGTKLAEGKETCEFEGRHYVFERALHADVALIEAWQGDRWGNLTYKEAGRNFNPVMATAAKLTIAQVQHKVDLGSLEPNAIATPSIFVNRVVHIPYGDPK